MRSRRAATLHQRVNIHLFQSIFELGFRRSLFVLAIEENSFAGQITASIVIIDVVKNLSAGRTYEEPLVGAVRPQGKIPQDGLLDFQKLGFTEGLDRN